MSKSHLKIKTSKKYPQIIGRGSKTGLQSKIEKSPTALRKTVATDCRVFTTPDSSKTHTYDAPQDTSEHHFSW